MDKLSESEQAELKTLSTARLTSKLTKADFTLKVLETMDRPAMLETWVNLVATGKGSETTGAKAAPLGYDVELERQKFEFQLAQDEKAERDKREQERLAFKKMKFNVEQSNMIERDKRDASEKVEREKREAEEKAERTKHKDRDKAKSDSTISKMKLFGDAIRYSVVKRETIL